MTVTAITRAKGHLVKILLSGGESVLLDSDLCAEKCIHEGDELSEEKIKDYVSESDYIRAKSRALWLLDRYSYSERRLFLKLKQAGFGEEASARALARLKELGVVDDASLALRYTEDLLRRGASKREAYGKLYEKGFNADIIRKSLDEVEFDEAAQIKELIERKYKAKLLAGDTEKVYSSLVRKGFSFAAVRGALKEYASELETIGDM